jgi:hypothetical protein
MERPSAQCHLQSLISIKQKTTKLQRDLENDPLGGILKAFENFKINNLMLDFRFLELSHQVNAT